MNAESLLALQTDRTAGLAPPRIMHVTEAPLGGVIAYLEEMLPAQIAMGYEIVVVTPEVNRETLAPVEALGATLITCPMERGSVASLLRFAQLVLQEARARRPDILHIHSTIAGVLLRPLRPFLPRETRIVYCAHGWAFLREGGRLRNGMIAGVERLLAHCADRIVCISENERAEALAAGLSDEKLVVIENGVSSRPPLHPAPRAPGAPRVIAFVGRFDRQKGFDLYAEVLNRLGAEAQGIAIGRAIVSRDDGAPLPANLRLLGWQPRDKVYELYGEADLLLVPSRWEGFGLVAVEAMQAGLPVFASRVGGLGDIVVDGETGRLFQPGDVDAIVRLVRETSDEELQAFGKAGRRRYVQKYTAARMNTRMSELYRSLATVRLAEAPAANESVQG